MNTADQKPSQWSQSPVWKRKVIAFVKVLIVLIIIIAVIVASQLFLDYVFKAAKEL